VADTNRCIHDNLPGQCGVSPCKTAPPGLATKVFITKGGAVFHRSAKCDALRGGQRKAFGRGQEIHDVRPADVFDAMADGYSACIPCFPDYTPKGTKLCWVLVGGRWVKGLLTRWEKDNGQWMGQVFYVVDIRQENALVTSGNLRPRKIGENVPPIGS
jgi:hypothetical protein